MLVMSPWPVFSLESWRVHKDLVSSNDNIVKFNTKPPDIPDLIKMCKTESTTAFISFCWYHHFDNNPILLEYVQHRFRIKTVGKLREK
ncbi:hypothetical protein L195_g038662 [Trifolium pratense]|uniref:Uncharacterized protein n=1 Tax=Trifolium pratense TaxID=57577 RepID=A0A2K3LVR9_TRIPR|nr:hypothetical protein L195_g038662 [Trifolium pratense]